MSDENIRISTSIPSLKEKIHTKLDGSLDTIYWYIRFNIPLDERTVSIKTMNVTDTDGYIMRTEITYSNEQNTIIISPIDSYEQNRYYLLNISKKVKSLSGQRLKSKIHILFKLINNQISEYRILKKNVTVPKPKPRTRNYDKEQIRSKIYTFDQTIFEESPEGKLPSMDLDINVILGVIGLLLVLGSLVFQSFLFTTVSVVICLAGIGHIVYQIAQKEVRSVLVYNKGVREFNKEKYQQAEISFKKSLMYNANNEYAEYAVNKVSFYL